MSHKIKINGDDGEFKVVLHDNDSDLEYSPLKAGKDGLYEHGEKLSDKYVLASRVNNIVQQARLGLATLQHCSATYLTDEDRVDAYVKSESDARYINKDDRNNIISESRNGLSLDDHEHDNYAVIEHEHDNYALKNHEHDADYTKISTFNSYKAQLNANTDSLSIHIGEFDAHDHDDKYLRKTDRAADSVKFEGKTKAQVVSEARSNLVKYKATPNHGANYLSSSSWVLNYASGKSSNLDHIWYDDSSESGFPGAYHAVADGEFKSQGNAAFYAGGFFENGVALKDKYVSRLEFDLLKQQVEALLS